MAQAQGQQPGYPMGAVSGAYAAGPPPIGFMPGAPQGMPAYQQGPPGQPPVVNSYPPPGGTPFFLIKQHFANLLIFFYISTVQFMPAPSGYANDPNVPPGLEYLTMIDQLLIKQKVELLEAFVGFETNNKYSIKNSMGQHVYYAVEGEI